jgi:hypothetical protein
MAVPIVAAAARWLRRSRRPAARDERAAGVLDASAVLAGAAEPLHALRALRERLLHGAVARLVAQPFWANARDAQLRRVVRLLGLDPGSAAGTAALRCVVGRLPRVHPLRLAFAQHAHQSICAFRWSRTFAAATSPRAGRVHRWCRRSTRHCSRARIVTARC